jgi:MPBQ/MSBQ methyltransferase
VQLGKSPLKLGAKAEESDKELSTDKRSFAMFALRLALGSLAGFYFFLVPIYMWIKDKLLTVKDKLLP